jgi:cytochrome c oxidase subunit I
MTPVKINRLDAKISLAHLWMAFVAIFIGSICGLLQGLVRGGVVELPAWISYYQLLTAHGVLLAIGFTTYFILGFLYAGMSRTTGTFPNRLRIMSWIGFALMTLGTALATAFIIAGQATVLYTFYAPLKASPFYYTGLALFIVGSLVTGFAMVFHYFNWKKQHKGEKTPIFGFMTVATVFLWAIACIGVVVTVLFQFIPWSFGWVPTINVVLSRTLFWYFGHPLVYFWLLPAYMAWYVVIPKIIGGKMFSDSLTRLVFILFILFSIPVGVHHQLQEAGISQGWKYLQVALTTMVVLPSIMTAFSMFATFETAGRAKGSRGLFGWFKKLPYGDVRFLAPFIAMLFFIPGGAGGIVNNSAIDSMVHNTLWIVGHFHITVGTPVALTFFGLTYWLIPYLTGRKLTPLMNKVGIIQTVLWSTGMFIMSLSMHLMGIEGVPRRTAYTTYGDHPTALNWISGHFASEHTMAVGGAVLFMAAMLMVYIVLHLSFLAPKSDETEFPISDAASDAQFTPIWLENWKVWTGICFVLVLIAYTIPLIDMIQNGPVSPPFRTW